MANLWHHPTVERFASSIDGVRRQFASADYGTNGEATFTRPATVPTRSDAILVSSATYNEDGEVFSTLDLRSQKSVAKPQSLTAIFAALDS